MKETSIYLPIPTERFQYDNTQAAKKISAQKKGTCWYYAQARIRTYYGKAADQNSDERRVEKAISKFRKKMTQADVARDAIQEKESWIDETLKCEEYQSLSKEGAKKSLMNMRLMKLLGEALPEEMETIFENFVKQDKFESLGKYLTGEKEALAEAKNEIEIEKLKAAKSCVHTIKQILGVKFKAPKFLAVMIAKKLTSTQEFIHNKSMISHATMELFDTKYANWHATDGVENLVASLKENGPHVVSGLFGRLFYKSKPKKSAKSYPKKKADIYYWERGSYNEQKKLKSSRSHVITHVIIIVGAKKENNRSLVYFVDPNDAGDANKVYCISYTRLMKSLDNVYNASGNQSGPFAFVADMAKRNAKVEALKKRDSELKVMVEKSKKQSPQSDENTGINANAMTLLKANTAKRNGSIASQATEGIDELPERHDVEKDELEINCVIL